MALLDSAYQQVIDVNHLKLWHQISARDMNESSLESDTKIHKTPSFALNEDINKRLALWVGDITQLSAQAIVHSTNERFNERSIHSERVLTKGGPQLRQYIANHLRVCKTGDAKISKGYDLAARYVIHTVGPKYNAKYHTAAESALYSCYASVLQLAREHSLKTLAICAVNTPLRGYPRQSAAHIALRVVRRFMEKHWPLMDVIVFAVEDIDIGIYEQLLPLYFPRSRGEEEYALYYLPQDIGGDRGQPIIPEREIRIAAKPNYSNVEESVDLWSGLDSSVAVGKSSFAKMQADVDQRYKLPQKSVKASDPLISEMQRKHKYERLLRKSKTVDFSDLIQARCLYVSGEDSQGRAVVVMIGKRFNASTMCDEKTIMYLISLLDPIVIKDYIVVYFHTLTQKENHPPIKFVERVYDLLGHEYKKNLKSLYIVHPSFWSRVLVWWFTTFNATILKRKLFCLGGVEYLNNVTPLQQLQVPSFVMDYDYKVNGVRYTEIQGAQTTVDTL